MDLVQPYLVKVAIDAHILRGDWAGLSHIVVLFFLALAVQYALRYAQIYFATVHVDRAARRSRLRAALSPTSSGCPPRSSTGIPSGA